MTHTLQLEIPEDIYNLLEQRAEQTKQPLEELAIQWLAKASQDFADDPLDKYIGAFTSGVPDWADKHDEYIGASLMDTHDNDDHEAT
ncbi:MAG TPA: hypothetical protein VGE04_12245 [Chloroflexia bacterium]|jgi:hypothetical protein